MADRTRSTIEVDSPLIATRREQARAILDAMPKDGSLYRHGPLCPCAGCVNAAVVRLIHPSAAWPERE